MILTTARLPMATLPTIARLAIWLHDYQVERLQLMMRKSDPALLQEQHQSHLYLPTHPSPTHPLTHSPTHPLTRSPAHPLTRSPTHPPTHPLTHSLPPHLRSFRSYIRATWRQRTHSASKVGSRRRGGREASRATALAGRAGRASEVTGDGAAAAAANRGERFCLRPPRRPQRAHQRPTWTAWARRSSSCLCSSHLVASSGPLCKTDSRPEASATIRPPSRPGSVRSCSG